MSWCQIILFLSFLCLFSCQKQQCLHGHLEEEKCVCDRFWEGADCSNPVCVHGNVIDAKCECISGATGPSCDEIYICIHGSIVSKTEYSKICVCNQGWQGIFCDHILCGARQKAVSKTKCECLDGFAPPDCKDVSWEVFSEPFFYVLLLFFAICLSLCCYAFKMGWYSRLVDYHRIMMERYNQQEQVATTPSDQNIVAVANQVFEANECNT